MNKYENVRLVIVDPSPLVRSGLKAALFSVGFRAISDTAHFVKLHDLLAEDAVDLLITSSEVENNDVGYLIREMRDQRLGTNPFVMAVVLLTSSDPDSVRRIIDSGADDLLLTPVAPDQLMGRVEKLARIRKPFVVTHDYTGPDRRTKQRAFTGQQAAVVEVPNPLKARLTDGLDGTRLARLIGDTASQVNRMKVERYSAQITWLVNHIHASVRDDLGEAKLIAEHTNRLVVVAEDMLRRARGTPAEAVCGHVQEVLATAQRLVSQPDGVTFTELERLADLAKGVVRVLGPGAMVQSG
jgi:DNA-binding NarL/FixJ family response regulator